MGNRLAVERFIKLANEEKHFHYPLRFFWENQQVAIITVKHNSRNSFSQY